MQRTWTGPPSSVLLILTCLAAACSSESRDDKCLYLAGALDDVVGRVELAYFAHLNARGGIDGRRVELLTVPPNTASDDVLPLLRDWVQERRVLALLSPSPLFTTGPARRYLDRRLVPRLFGFTEPALGSAHDPVTAVPGGLDPLAEGGLLASYVVSHVPGPRIAILTGPSSMSRALRLGALNQLAALGASSLVVAERSHGADRRTVRDRLRELQQSRINVLLDFADASYLGDALAATKNIGWPAVHLVSSGVGAAGYRGVLKPSYLKDPADPGWRSDPGAQAFEDFTAHLDSRDRSDPLTAVAYTAAQLMEHILRRVAGDPTRGAVIRQAGDLHDAHPSLFLPGLKVSGQGATGPLQQAQIVAHDGRQWVRKGPVMRYTAPALPHTRPLLSEDTSW